jgi:hypothetical protein
MNLKSRVNKLEDTADRVLPEVVSYTAKLEHALAVKARLRKWSKSELNDYRTKLAEATKAVAGDKNLPPHDGTYKARLERAKAIQAELKNMQRGDRP